MRLTFRSLVPAALLAAAAVMPLRAQTAADIRSKQMAMLQQEQRIIISMIDSMPQQWFRERATAGQRDFAMQLFHAAVTYPFFVGRFLGGPAMPGATDSIAATASKDALRGYINNAYQYAQDVLRNQTDAARMAEVNLFGNRMPAWQVWGEMHDHTMWTLGQAVANFRMHNLRPAPFQFF